VKNVATQNPSRGKNTKKLAPGEIIMFPNQQIRSPTGMFVPEVLRRQLNQRVLCLGSAFAVCSGTAGWLGAFANVLRRRAPQK
jgi:hypothetical protein